MYLKKNKTFSKNYYTSEVFSYSINALNEASINRIKEKLIIVCLFIVEPIWKILGTHITKQ